MTLPTHTRDAAPTRLTVDGYAAFGDTPEQARGIDEITRSVDYVCSTEALDSHGTVLRQTWNLDRYRKNPVVLFCHNSRSIPVGTASMVRVEGGRLLARVTFATEEVSEDAEECWRAVKAGLLRGISVGFLAHTYRWETENDVERMVLDDLELLELSVCAVPSNPETLAQRDALSILRATAQRQRPTKEHTPMTEQEIKALRDAHAAREADLQQRADQAARDADAARREIAERDQRLAAMTAEAERLGTVNADLQARATAAEDALLRAQVEASVGVNVDPSEVDHFVALRKAAPALYDAEMKRRAGRNDALTQQTIPADAPAQREAPGAGPVDAFNDALSRHLPAKE